TIGIVDFDDVENSNLLRQIIHNEKSIGHCKTKSAGEHLKMLNSTINIIEHQNINIDRDLFTPGNDCVFSSYDVIVDCTDNIDTRYLLSDVSRISKRILVCASVLKWEGQVFVFMLDGPCYRCLFPERKSNIITCNTAGVIGPACGIIGSIQALEVVKVILGITKKSK
ncbi:Adenylyltransferase and sulfurtransferase MOCS3, partial [Dictyocoela roeselum]